MHSTNPQRNLPSRKLIKRELDSGKLGEPGLVRVHYWESGGDGEGNAADLPAAILEQIDLILWLMGKAPKLVHAVERPPDASKQSGRYLQIQLGFPGSAMALFVYSSLLPAGVPYRSLHVIGSAGAAYTDDQMNMQLLYEGGQARGVLAEEQPSREHGLVEVPQDWKPALVVAAAVRQSLATRQAVSLEGH